MTTIGKDTQEAMAALERLHARNVITLEEAQTAARLLTDDPALVFPPARQASAGPGPRPSEGVDAPPMGTPE